MKRHKLTKHEIKVNRCECSDPGCPNHKGQSKCNAAPAIQLFRVDMEDESGIIFCHECADDAMDSGLFSN